MDYAQRCHVGHGLSLGLKHLANSTTEIAADKTTHSSMLLILDMESKWTENSTSRGSHFECLIANIRILHKVTSQACGGSLSEPHLIIGGGCAVYTSKMEYLLTCLRRSKWLRCKPLTSPLKEAAKTKMFSATMC